MASKLMLALRRKKSQLLTMRTSPQDFSRLSDPRSRARYELQCFLLRSLRSHMSSFHFLCMLMEHNQPCFSVQGDSAKAEYQTRRTIEGHLNTIYTSTFKFFAPQQNQQHETNCSHLSCGLRFS